MKSISQAAKDCASTSSKNREPGRPEHTTDDSDVYRPKEKLRVCRYADTLFKPCGQRVGSGTILPSGPRCADQPSSEST